MRNEYNNLELSSFIVSRGFDPLPDDLVICPAAVHISVDPVTGERTIAVYTDDGRGNGDHIMSVYFVESDQ